MQTTKVLARAGGSARTAKSFCRSLPCAVLLCAALPAVRAPAQTPSNPSTVIAQLARQAESDLHNGKPEVAAEEYRKILALDPNNVSAHSNLGLAEYLRGNYAPAAVEFKAALHLKPDIWNDAALCGLSEAKIGENGDAEVHLQQAFEHVSEASLRLAVGKQLYAILLEANQYERAAEVVETLQQFEPKNPDVLYAAHQVHSLLAEKAFLTMAQLAPDSARVYELRGDRMAEIGNMKGAILAYRSAIERDPHLSSVHLALGEALSISQDAAERAQAESEYKKALADNPSDEKAECRLGDIEKQRSNFDAAKQHYKRALELQPDDPDANEGLGVVLFEEGAIQEARTYLNRTVQLDPANAAAYYHLSQASRGAGDLDQAKREMDQFLKLKTQEEDLKRSFDDLPSRAARQAREAQGDQPAPAAVSNGAGDAPAQQAH